MVEQFFEFDRSKSLQELEGLDKGEPQFKSHLVTTCVALMGKPVKHFTPEDLRIMIGQNLGLRYLIPLAIELLEDDILTEGNFYPGDLLEQVLKADPNFWRDNPNMKSKVEETISQALSYLNKQLEEFKLRVNTSSD